MGNSQAGAVNPSHPSPPADSSIDRSRSRRGSTYGHVIIGLDGRAHDLAALALGVDLRHALAATLTRAHVIAPVPPGQGRLALLDRERRDGQQLVSTAAARLVDHGRD